MYMHWKSVQHTKCFVVLLGGNCSGHWHYGSVVNKLNKSISKFLMQVSTEEVL